MSNLTMYPHQAAAIEDKNPRIALMWDRQTGKTTFIAERLRRMKKGETALVIMPTVMSQQYLLGYMDSKAKLIKSKLGSNWFDVKGRTVIFATYHAVVDGLIRGLGSVDVFVIEEPDSDPSSATSIIQDPPVVYGQMYMVGTPPGIELTEPWKAAEAAGFCAYAMMKQALM